MTAVSIIGAGAWGAALALAALRAGRSVTLLSMCDDQGVPFSPPHEYVKYAASIPGNPSFQLTTDVKAAAARGDLIVFVPPAQHMRVTCSLFQGLIGPTVPLIIASKGIEDTSVLLMSDVVKEFFPDNPILVLSGPSFAEDVSQNLPTAVSLAGDSLSLSEKIAGLLGSPFFHLYPSADLVGTQIGGAIKNVIAIACGIVEGRGLGDNVRAAVVARGLVELARLGQKMGAQPETFLGLAGVGDITLTCYCGKSRNQSFGYALGQGTPLKELLASKSSLTEGVHTVAGAIVLAKRYQVDMPLTFALSQLLQGEINVEEFLSLLLKRVV